MTAAPNAIAHIAITTNTAGTFGGVAATVTAWLYLGKPDLSMIINGILAGLVAVTVGCAFINIYLVSAEVHPWHPRNPRRRAGRLDIGEHAMEAYSGFLKEAGAGGVRSMSSGMAGNTGGVIDTSMR